MNTNRLDNCLDASPSSMHATPAKHAPKGEDGDAVSAEGTPVQVDDKPTAPVAPQTKATR